MTVIEDVPGLPDPYLALRLWRARVQGIRDLAGLGSLQGLRLGFVDGPAGEVDRIGGVGLRPLSPPLGGLRVEARSSCALAPRAFISSRRR
jgi:hypothetical protein